MSKEGLTPFVYNYLSGPVAEEELRENPIEGNCRFAVQYYHHAALGRYIPPEDVLNPNAYLNVGEFVIREIENPEQLQDVDLEEGDIIYAERLRNKTGKDIHEPKDEYKSYEDWILHLHTAIYSGDEECPIYHATSIEGTSCSWSWDRFNKHYTPVCVKRLSH